MMVPHTIISSSQVLRNIISTLSKYFYIHREFHYTENPGTTKPLHNHCIMVVLPPDRQTDRPTQLGAAGLASLASAHARTIGRPWHQDASVSIVLIGQGEGVSRSGKWDGMFAMMRFVSGEECLL